MILNKLVLENFGIFKGVNELNLRPKESSKPLVLFGGKNGSGKTTILNALCLCLYGINFENKPMSKKTYEDYLRNKIHSTKFVHDVSSASVGLEFEVNYLGVTSKYYALRSWSLVDGEVHEEFSLKKDGKRMDVVEESYWEAFIRDMVPKGIFDLFFFDGEKIKNLAENGYSYELRKSINNLIGLDLVDKLRTDLNIYKSKKVKEFSSKSILEKIEKFDREIDSMEKSIEGLRQQRDQKSIQVDQQKLEINRIETKLSDEGGLFAKNRDELKERKNIVDSKISMVEDKLRSLSGDLLPFVFAPKLLKALKKRIVLESKQQEFVSMKKAEKDLLENVFMTIKDSDVVSTEDKGGLIKDITENVKKTDILNPSITLLHQFSRPQEQRILYALSLLESETSSEFVSLVQELEKLTVECRDLERHISFAPSDDVVGDLMKKLNEVNRGLGSLGAEFRKIDERIRSDRFKLDNLVRDKSACEARLSKNKNLERRFKLVEGVQRVLDEYSVSLAEQKLRLLEKHFLECFSRLSRKKIHVSGVRIDPMTFDVSLYESGDRVKRREDLSEGEKQIFAVSLLWALIKTSGRSLPLVVDTPLARLDSDHRGTFIQDFFPKAGKQVIVLSTDTEIDERYFEMVKPYLSHPYRLSFNDKDGFTVVEEGYFWEVS